MLVTAELRLEMHTELEDRWVAEMLSSNGIPVVGSRGALKIDYYVENSYTRGIIIGDIDRSSDIFIPHLTRDVMRLPQYEVPVSKESIPKPDKFIGCVNDDIRIYLPIR